MWTEKNGKLVNQYLFSNFKDAISFINEVAKVCDQVNHHPEIYNCYNLVRLSLCTHDSEGEITEKDFRLATLIDKFAK